MRWWLWRDRGYDPKRLIVHHAGFAFEGWPKPRLDDQADIMRCVMLIINEIDSWHLKKWPSGFGYHYVIGNGNGIPEGMIVQIRPDEKIGVNAKYHNHDSLGILMVGNYQVDKIVPDLQYRSLMKLCANLCIKYHLDPRANYEGRHSGKVQMGPMISGHRDWPEHRTNECPGISLYQTLPSLRGEVSKLVLMANQLPPDQTNLAKPMDLEISVLRV